MNFYKRYIGDIQRDTGHLSCAEMGIYDRLLDHYYATEKPLLSDIDACCRIARAMSRDEKAAVSSILSQFFLLTDEGYIQNRAESEIAEAQAKIIASKTNGSLGGRPRKNPTITQAETQKKPSGFLKQNPNGTQGKSPPDPEPDIQETSGEVVAFPASVTEDLPPPPNPCTTRPDVEPFPMFPEWEPSPSFDSLAAMAGLPLGADTPIESLMEFRVYWLVHPDTHRTQGQWEHAFIKSLKTEKLRGRA